MKAYTILQAPRNKADAAKSPTQRVIILETFSPTDDGAIIKISPYFSSINIVSKNLTAGYRFNSSSAQPLQGGFGGGA